MGADRTSWTLVVGSVGTPVNSHNTIGASTMTTPSISFVSLGLVVLDEIRLSNEKPLTDVVGGSGAYGWFLSGPLLDIYS